jgi:hypothetical protein
MRIAHALTGPVRQTPVRQTPVPQTPVQKTPWSKARWPKSRMTGIAAFAAAVSTDGVAKYRDV